MNHQSTFMAGILGQILQCIPGQATFTMVPTFKIDHPNPKCLAFGGPVARVDSFVDHSTAHRNGCSCQCRCFILRGTDLCSRAFLDLTISTVIALPHKPYLLAPITAILILVTLWAAVALRGDPVLRLHRGYGSQSIYTEIVSTVTMRGWYSVFITTWHRIQIGYFLIQIGSYGRAEYWQAASPPVYAPNRSSPV